MTPVNGHRLLLLAAGDDVYVATTALCAGEVVDAEGGPVLVRDPVELGHKVAARAIAEGQKVVRHGMAIGSATTVIERGQWVHTHNLRSDYLATVEHRGGGG